MALAEGVSGRIAFKQHSSGVITPGVEPDFATDPGASGGQILRRVSSTLALSKDTYQSNEIRGDRQIVDFRHGVKRVQGNISGELSPLTYADFFEAAFRGTWEAAVTASQSDFTSVSADNATSKFTFSAGNPVTKGFRVGHMIRFADLSDADNNAKNFLILAFGGTSNREVTVYPAPDTMTADSAFTLASIGKRLVNPSSSFISRKYAIEIWNQDVDVARLFTECRCGGFNAQLPASGIGTVDFDFMGRNMTMYEDSAAPFFSAPAAETTTGVTAAVNGLLRASGQTIAVITGLNIQLQLSASADPVVGSNLVPEIFLGRANVSGQLTAFFENADLINDFVNESEIELLAYLTTTSAVNTPALTFYMPRVKLGGADLQTQGEGGQSLTIPYQALKSTAVEASTGIASTTLQICDSEIV
ncbi:MAG: phage tail tube protein [Bradyrhizobium sp.]|uniref:phage tail tube protein n=1 Tax=Bradyrhizobium sp. TaxID=376 RepID=UPI0029BDF5FD|nr:phage tail tube protein [Bradyrhizobium sp.]MDX3971168.1 phage tail tube protein [Bradyrhizobium sp.]